jgi:hypothetical protein
VSASKKKKSLPFIKDALTAHLASLVAAKTGKKSERGGEVRHLGIEYLSEQA